MVPGCQIRSLASYVAGTPLRTVTDAISGPGANPRLWFLAAGSPDFLLYDPRSEERSGKTLLERGDEASFLCVDAAAVWTRPLAGSLPTATAGPGTPTAAPTAAPTSAPTTGTFTGQGGKTTPVFSVDTWSFTLAWTVQSDSPEGADFAFLVFPEGEAAEFACEAFFEGVGSDSTVCRGGPGRFYLDVLAANLSSWTLHVSGPPPVAALPATFAGRGDKATATFRTTAPSFTLAWSAQSDRPDLADFAFFVYPEGDLVSFVCEATFQGTGSDVTVCSAPPGDYYVDVLAANLTSWRMDVTQ